MLSIEGEPGFTQDAEKSLTVDPSCVSNVQEVVRPEAARTPQKSYVKVKQVLLILIALPTFVTMPLTVNWSVVVPVPPAAEYTRVTALARSRLASKFFSADDWYGVKLNYRPGMNRLFVEEVDGRGLASGGVLPGDLVTRGTQGNERVFSSDDFKKGDHGVRLLEEVMCFINTLPNEKLPCELEFLNVNKALQVDFDMAHVDVSKGDAYLTVGIIFLRNVVGAVFFVPIAMACGMEELRQLFTARSVGMLMILGVGRALAHIFEILANGKINAALFAVVTQSRLVGVAGLAYLILGTKQTTVQILLLTSISIIICCYVQVPDSVPVSKYWNGFGQPRDPDAEKPEQGDSIGIIYAILKTIFTVLIGVIGQKILQDPLLKGSSLIAVQAATFVVSAVPLFFVTVVYMLAIQWPHGLFGGPDVVFRHCRQDWDASRCAETIPVARVKQGWDYRTFAVLFMYTISEPIVNALVKIFSALSKDLLNCTATVATYFFGIVALGREFNFTKCGLAFAVVFQVVQYTLVPKHVDPKNHNDQNYVMTPRQLSHVSH